MDLSISQPHEMIVSAKKKVAKKTTNLFICLMFTPFLLPLINVTENLSENQRMLCAVITIFFFLFCIISLIKSFTAYSIEKSLYKIDDMTIGEFKKFYLGYPKSPKKKSLIDEKCIYEDILIKLALHLRHEGSFAETLDTKMDVKAMEHESVHKSTYAIRINQSLDDRLNAYIIDVFLSTSHVDHIRLDSIDFKK